MHNFSVIGKKIQRYDGMDLVTGQAQFIDDVRIPKMLYGKSLHPSYPHARILDIDTSKAKKVIGVKAVATADDTPKLLIGCPNPYFTVMDFPIFAQDKTRYYGDSVAAVAAIDKDTAEEALDLIKVEYEPLPILADPEEAMRPGAPVIHDLAPNNIVDHVKVYAGDIEKGFRESDIIIEGTYKTQPQEHANLEPHGAIASVGLSGDVTVWTTTQSAYVCRHDLKKITGIPYGKINVIPTKCGGAFGGKNEITLEAQCVVLARMTGRPVKMMYTREEEFTASTVRHPVTIESRIGVKKDGTIMSKQARAVVDNGAYTALGQGMMYVMGAAYAAIYQCQNIKFDSYLVYTNNIFGGACRGYGNPQITFAMETDMDRVAEALDMDPIELRLKNAQTPGKLSANGIVIPPGFDECIKRAAEIVGWNRQWKGWGK